MVTVEAALPRRTTLRVALQDFALLSPGADAWYNVGGAIVHQADRESVSSHVGNELDVTVRFPVGAVGLEVGYGRFFGGAYLRDADFARDTADFFYLQTMVGFRGLPRSTGRAGRPPSACPPSPGSSAGMGAR